MLDLDLLRKIAQADPTKLPPLMIHDNNVWPGPAMCDTKGSVHMCEADLWRLKNKGIVVKLVASRGPGVCEYKIDLSVESLTGGKEKPLDDKKSKINLMLDKNKED